MNSANSNFYYTFQFKEDDKKTQTIIEFPIPPERKNGEYEQEDIGKIEKFACFVNRLFYGSTSSKEILSELNPILVKPFKYYSNAKSSPIQLEFKYFGSLPGDCILRKLDSFQNNFSLLYKWSQKILLYLIEAEKMNYILDTIEIEQIVMCNNNNYNLKIVPNIDRIKEFYLFRTQNKYTPRGTDGEAPELSKGLEKSNFEALIEDPKKLVVYSYAILVLKLFNLLDEPTLVELKLNKVSQSSNDKIIAIPTKIIEKYQNVENKDQLSKFAALLQKCLTFNPKNRLTLEQINNEITTINFGNEEYNSIMMTDPPRTYSHQETQTLESSNLNYKVKSEESSKMIEKNSKSNEDVFKIINLLDQHKEGEIINKDEIISVIVNINSEYFKNYYSQKTEWNFTNLAISNEQLNILEELAFKSKLSVSSITFGETIFIGNAKTNKNDKNLKLFNDNDEAFKRIMKMIQRFKSLTTLKLDCFISGLEKFNSLVGALKSCKCLVELSLNHIPIADVGLECLIDSVNLSDLKILNLYNTSITNQGAEKLFKMLIDSKNGPKKLHSINLGKNKIELNEEIIEKKKMDSFFKFLKSFKLKSFNLSGSSNNINPIGIMEIVNCLYKKNLEYLNLGNLSFDSQSMEYLLSILNGMPQLNFLDLSHAVKKEGPGEIENQVIFEKFIQPLQNLSRLEVLCLRGWTIPEKWFVDLCNILQRKVNAGFKEICIGRCKIANYNGDQLEKWFKDTEFTFRLDSSN